MKRLALVLAVVLAAACGDDNPQLQDSSVSDTPDATPPATTFTSFVIALITNETKLDNTPHAFTDFSTLPDPDGDTNNTAAYSSLFP